jgi:hypothetical protein
MLFFKICMLTDEEIRLLAHFMLENNYYKHYFGETPVFKFLEEQLKLVEELLINEQEGKTSNILKFDKFAMMLVIRSIVLFFKFIFFFKNIILIVISKWTYVILKYPIIVYFFYILFCIVV